MAEFQEDMLFKNVSDRDASILLDIMGRKSKSVKVWTKELRHIDPTKYKPDLILDLDYEEDCVAELDSNFVMSGDGRFIEVQATGEQHPFSAEQLTQLMQMAADGCKKLIDLQNQVLD